jgi:hypothetical protein
VQPFPSVEEGISVLEFFSGIGYVRATSHECNTSYLMYFTPHNFCAYRLIIHAVFTLHNADHIVPIRPVISFFC